MTPPAPPTPAPPGPPASTSADHATVGRYLAHFRGYWPSLLLSAALMGVSAAIPGAAVWLLKDTLDQMLAGGQADRIGLLAAGFAGLYVVSGVASVWRTYTTKRIAWDVTSRLRRELHARYLALSPEQQATTGERIAALTGDVDELQYGVSAVVTAFRNPLTLLVLAVTAVKLAPMLAPWALLLLPAVWLPTRWGGDRLRRVGTAVRTTRAALSKLAQEQLAGLRTVQSHVAEDGERARFADVEAADREARLRLEVERVVPSAVVEAVAAVALGLLLWLGGRQVVAGTLAPGDLVGFAVALGLMNRPLSGLSEVWALMQRSLAALEKVYATLDTMPAIVDEPDAVDVPKPPLSIAWEAVTVDYGDGPVVRDLDLAVAPGELVALVGATGEGKTSLLKLVSRQRDADRGFVRLGGVDVRRLKLSQLRRAVAVVQQEGFLFARTIAENLALGRPDATREQIERAARTAGAHEFVATLPRGYDTPLDELGRNLSGGERQRLCLARALVMDAPVVLLDEATNQVDAETEAAILAALQQVRGGKTIVVVAHNLLVAQQADRIALIEGGKVAESGTHEALLQRKGRYSAMWKAQGRQEVA